MDNLETVLQEEFDKSPEEIEVIMQRIKEGIQREGKSEIEILIEVFGEDVTILLKILGEKSSA